MSVGFRASLCFKRRHKAERKRRPTRIAFVPSELKAENKSKANGIHPIGLLLFTGNPVGFPVFACSACVSTAIMLGFG